MKIGIFGGSFDPFTIGHANVVKKAFQQLKLDKIIIVPTTVNYYRPDKRYLFTFDEKVRIIQNFTCGIRENVEIDTIGHITGSLGVATYFEHTDNVEELLELTNGKEKINLL